MLTSCIGKVETSTNSDIVRVGQKLPLFEVTMNNGMTFKSSSLHEKASVIIFFNTACIDCRKELLVVQKIYMDYGKYVHFLCISRAEEETSVNSYWKNNALTLPYSAQETKDIYSLFATSIIPRVYISDKSGTIRECFSQKVSENQLRKALNKVMQ